VTTEKGLPLSSFGIGEKLVIVGFSGCNMQKRLCNMGVGCGSEIEILRNGSSGPLIIHVRSIRLAIGRGVASKILCKRAD